MDSAEHFYAKDRNAWLNWLDKNHESQKSVWIINDKTKDQNISYDDLVEVALCFGWVDSRYVKIDESTSKTYVSKRKSISPWSKSNKVRVKSLIEQKLMRPSGFEMIKIAKSNGSWDMFSLSDKLIVPEEMKTLFKENKKAEDNFNSFSPSSRRLILEWIYSARQEETKLRRIKKTIELAEQGIKANQ